MAIQLEFPFTRNGCLYKYNCKQQQYYEHLFYKHVSGGGEWIPFTSFLMQVIPTAAELFREQYGYILNNDVGLQNESVLEKWQTNSIHDGLEKKLCTTYLPSSNTHS